MKLSRNLSPYFLELTNDGYWYIYEVIYQQMLFYAISNQIIDFTKLIIPQ